MKQKIYFVSGLGADWRVFSALNLPHIEPVYIQWERPESQDDMASYALKLLKQIDKKEQVVLIGISFGGMLAVEMGKQLPNCKVILISSAAKAKDIPRLYQILGKLSTWIPFYFFRTSNFLTYYYFGVQHPQHKTLLQDILWNTDEHFFRWAIQAILKWKNQEIPTNLIQIHGNQDKILPLIERSSIIIIPKGGHFMILEQAPKLSNLLKKYTHNPSPSNP